MRCGRWGPSAEWRPSGRRWGRPWRRHRRPEQRNASPATKSPRCGCRCTSGFMTCSRRPIASRHLPRLLRFDVGEALHRRRVGRCRRLAEQCRGFPGSVPRAEAICKRLVGRSPWEFLLDDTLGGVLMAVYDLLGQAAGLPVSRLFGTSPGSASFRPGGASACRRT